MSGSAATESHRTSVRSKASLTDLPDLLMWIQESTDPRSFPVNFFMSKDSPEFSSCHRRRRHLKIENWNLWFINSGDILPIPYGLCHTVLWSQRAHCDSCKLFIASSPQIYLQRARTVIRIPRNNGGRIWRAYRISQQLSRQISGGKLYDGHAHTASLNGCVDLFSERI